MLRRNRGSARPSNGVREDQDTREPRPCRFPAIPCRPPKFPNHPRPTTRRETELRVSNSFVCYCQIKFLAKGNYQPAAPNVLNRSFPIPTFIRVFHPTVSAAKLATNERLTFPKTSRIASLQHPVPQRSHIRAHTRRRLHHQLTTNHAKPGPTF